MQRINRIIFTLLLMMCSACTPKYVWQQLDLSAQLMNNRADTALVILESINKKQLHSESAEARYSLLYSQALDKHYVDLTTDSLLEPALRYYNRGRGTAHDRMLANYLLGRIHYNAGRYLYSMAALLEAEEEVDYVDDSYLVGLLYAYKGFLHSEFYDNPSALKALRLADSCFLQGQHWKLHKHTLLNIAQAYMNMQEYALSEELFLDLLNTATAEQDAFLSQKCVDFLLTQYMNQEDHVKAKVLLNRLEQKVDSTSFLYAMALAQIKASEGSINEAQELILKAQKQATNSRDISRTFFTRYRLHQTLGNYKEALDHYKKVTHIQDTVMRRVLRQPIIATQRDFYRTQAELRAEQIRNTQILYGALFAILGLLVVIIIMQFRHRIAMKQAEVGQYVGLLDELREKSNTDTIEMNMQIAKLFADQFSLLNQLSTIYYETHAFQKDKDAIYKKVREEIGYWSDDKKHHKDLESVVNSYKNNVMAIIRREIPSFSELDLRILCYWYAGFSTKAMSVFLANTISMINTRKHRLRNKMIQLQPPSLALILENIP